MTLNQLKSHGLLASLFFILFCAASLVFVYYGTAIATVKSSSPQYLLARLATEKTRKFVAAPDPDILRRAVAAEPLNPAIVNSAVFAEVFNKNGRMPSQRKIDLLRRLGWRNTTALQNLILSAVNRQDLREIADIADALLRRREVSREATALMNLMELTPSSRRIVVDKLLLQPEWATDYLAQAYQFSDPRQLSAREQVMVDLMAANYPVVPQEVTPLVMRLVTEREVQKAYALWTKYRRTKPALLNDQSFKLTYSARNNPEDNMPFEWALESGPGYVADVFEQAGNIRIQLNWNGRGAPTLSKQQLWLPANLGILKLKILTDTPSRELYSKFIFRLQCAGKAVVFDQVVERDSKYITLRANDNVICQDPMFEITGRPGVNDASSSLALYGSSEPIVWVINGLSMLQ